MTMNASNHLHGPISPDGRIASAERERRDREQRVLAPHRAEQLAPAPRKPAQQQDPVDSAGSWTDSSSIAMSSAVSEISLVDAVGPRRRRARVPGQDVRKPRSPVRDAQSISGASDSDASDSEDNVSSSEWSTTTSDSAKSSTSFDSRRGSGAAEARARSRSRRTRRHDTRRERTARAARDRLPRRRRDVEDTSERSEDYRETGAASSTDSVCDSVQRGTLVRSPDRGGRRRGRRMGTPSVSRSRSPSPEHAHGRNGSGSRSQTLTRLVEQSLNRTGGYRRHDSRRERAARAAQTQLQPQRHSRRSRHNRETDSGNDTDTTSSTDSLNTSIAIEPSEYERERRESQRQRRRLLKKEALQQEQEDQEQLSKFFDGWRQAVVRATIRKRRLQKDAERTRRNRSRRIREAELGRQVREQTRLNREKQEQQEHLSLQQRSPARRVHKHVPPSRLEVSLSPILQHCSDTTQEQDRLRLTSASPLQLRRERSSQEPEPQNTDRPVVHRVRGRRVQSVQLSPASSPTDLPRHQHQQPRTRPEVRTTPAERERAGVLEYPPPAPVASLAAAPKGKPQPKHAAHWDFLRQECDPSGIMGCTDGGESLRSISALLLKVAAEIHNEHTATNLAHGRKIDAATNGTRTGDPPRICSGSIPLEMLARVVERCGRDVEAAHIAQDQLSRRVVQLEGLLSVSLDVSSFILHLNLSSLTGIFGLFVGVCLDMCAA